MLRCLLLFASIALALRADSWNASISVSRDGEFLHVGKSYASSSSLRIRWTAPDLDIHHYQLTAVEQRSEVRHEVAGGTTECLLENLKAATEYEIRLKACLDEECSESLDAEQAVRGATEQEYWRIQGRGNSFATADRVVPDGNVGSYAMRYGPWKGEALDGKIQLYYTPMQQQEKGVKIGELIAPAADSIEAVSVFRGVSGYGLLRVCEPLPSPPGSPMMPDPACTNTRSAITGLALFQAIPVTPEKGGFVRLYIEAPGPDSRTRIYYLDSQDGYLGRDFHRGSPTRCDTLADYSPGGGCEPTLAIGVDVDGERGNPNLLNARQFKIGYPTLDSWAWDMSPGTFMWFTTEWQDRRCSPFGFNAVYAVWNGERWVVQYGENGCPKLIAGAQAPALVHLGGSRYKLYFNRHATPGGVTNPQIALKPMQMLYADPEQNGDTAWVDFEDWEPLSAAREVNYLWPDGTLLNVMEESKLDDYIFMAPTNDPKLLIMYSNMSFEGPNGLPFIGSAVLVNP